MSILRFNLTIDYIIFSFYLIIMTVSRHFEVSFQDYDLVSHNFEILS